MEEKLRLDIQKLLYDMIVGENDPDLPENEYAPEAAQLTKWILEAKPLSSEPVADQLAAIFSKMFDDAYTSSDFEEIAKRINLLLSR
ncbi:MAG TPA: hypothetical protein VLG09_05905 [Candidatus Saccharimonadales bacterium]|nr:hypothetical protein [Candidatus Saccharimonadales bacterium]